MTKKTTKPIFETDKQTMPLTGEVTPENARPKGIIFATQIKARMKNKNVKKPGRLE